MSSCPHKIIEDVYFPASAQHAHLRIRRNGDDYELTKKTPLDPNDKGLQREENIMLTPEEYQALSTAKGRAISKVRYYMPYEGYTAEIDVFSGALTGLISAEVEFETVAEKAAFTMPDFCLVDITQDEHFAGGVLAGKSYEDVRDVLERYYYTPMHFSQ